MTSQWQTVVIFFFFAVLFGDASGATHFSFKPDVLLFALLAINQFITSLPHEKLFKEFLI